MKTTSKYFYRNGALLFGLVLLKLSSFGQGRVVINEFMPWSGCNTTSEFVELLNFGPGPMNIGCYTITNGQYAVTIPPNTVLQPKQYYVLAGQNVIAKNCGNIDSAITVDLNWSTCNCTNAPIPTTGDGFLKDGGGANEKVVLLDPSLNVVDAVSRQNPPSASVSLTTSSVDGACTSKTFDLATMPISYEIIGQSTGIDNSYSRKVDGDCGWQKTPKISARAPNKTGSTSSATYEFNTLSASECTGTTGSISINVSAENVELLFPMQYTLGYDVDSNGLFTSADQYIHGIDSSASTIDIKGLLYGRYRITVATVMGCNLKTFDFFIFNCYGIVLPLKLESFTYKGAIANDNIFSYRLSDPENLKLLTVEEGDGRTFKAIKNIEGAAAQTVGEIKITSSSAYSYYRLKAVDRLDNTVYSSTVRTPVKPSPHRLWTDPLSQQIFIELAKQTESSISYTIYNAGGILIKSGKQYLSVNQNRVTLSTKELMTGIYLLKLVGKETSLVYRFSK